MGEGAGAGQPVVSGYIADKINMEKRSSIFTTLAVSNGLAATVGSLMAGLPTYFQSALAMDMIRAHTLLFWIGAFGGVASILLNLTLKDVKPVKIVKETEKQRPLKSKSWGGNCPILHCSFNQWCRIWVHTVSSITVLLYSIRSRRRNPWTHIRRS